MGFYLNTKCRDILMLKLMRVSKGLVGTRTEIRPSRELAVCDQIESML